VPAHFVRLDAMPLTPNGKVDRKALPAPSADNIAARKDSYVAPRTDLETSLAAAWQQVLGVGRVGIHDNFFDLGGNSLAVFKLIAEMEKACGIEISLGAVFGYPTIAGLVESLGSGAAKDASLVVPLQPEGEEAAIFCLSGISLYQELANSLGTRQPVYAVYVPEEQLVTMQALDAGKLDVSSMRLAKAYYDAIIRVAPHGPYRLAGSSFGGIVALEVAAMMRKDGARVDAVIMLDTLSPRAVRRDWVQWARQRAGEVISGEAKGKILRKLSKVRSRFAALGAASAEQGQQRSPGEEARELRLAAYHAATSAWKMRTLDIDFKVVLLRESDKSWGPSFQFEHDYGWNHYFNVPISVELVSGDHLGMLQSPHVADLAARIQKFLAVS
jgi:thioesterase domain-containing protein/acyl carrier protein